MEYSKYLVTKERDNGVKFFCCSDDAPEYINDLVQGVHFDLFDGCAPNDWIYEQIVHALDELEDKEDLEDITVEADIYYSDLYRWLQNRFASWCCDDAVAEGFADGKEIDKTLQAGNWLAKDRIYRYVAEWIQERREEQ